MLVVTKLVGDESEVLIGYDPLQRILRDYSDDFSL